MKAILQQLLMIFSFILLISVNCFEKNTNKQQKVTHKNKQKQRYKIIQQTDNDTDHYANKIFKQNPMGRDKYENFFEESAYLIETKLNPKNELIKDPPYKLVNLKLNRNALFYSNNDPSYRGVLGSIQLVEIITPEDKPEQGQCCKNIGDNTANKILIGGDLIEAKCFKITAQFDIWSICFTSQQKAQRFKKQLLIRIITSQLEKQGIFNVTFVNDVSTQKSLFSWKDQASWDGLCKQGMAQSPIQIVKGQSLSFKGMRLKFSLQAHSVIESKNLTQNQHAQAIYDGQQINILGNFGQISHFTKSKYRDFTANKLQFKFKSEHTIDNEYFDCEILIHATSDVGTKAITSVLLKIDEEDLTEDNKFLDDLDFDLWEFKQDHPFPLEKQPNILNLLDSILQKDDYAQKFYWYMGSETEPACEEGVFRYILATPIYVPRAQLNALKSKTYNNIQEPNGNIKIPIPLTSQRQLYYHEEKACPKVQQTFIPPVPEESKEKKECPESQLKYIKATSEIHSYTYVDQDIKTGQIKEGVKIDAIQPEKLPAAVGKILKENAKIIAQRNCRDQRILQQQLELENSKKKYKKNYQKKDSKEGNVVYEKYKDNVYDDLPDDVIAKK